jgi:hypothetical protein
MADNDSTVSQSFRHGVMFMRITVTVMMFSACVTAVLFAEVSGEGILSHGTVDGSSVFDFHDGEVRAAPEMGCNLSSVFGGNCDFHLKSSFS